MIVLGLQDLNEDEYDDAIEIMSNSHLNNNFLNLARELDIMEPKTPEDVYKSHLVKKPASTFLPNYCCCRADSNISFNYIYFSLDAILGSFLLL